MQVQFEDFLNLPEIEVQAVLIENAVIHIHCQSKLPFAYCLHCLKRSEKINQYQVREIRDLPLMGKKVILHLKSRQFICVSCHRYYYERFYFVDSHETVTQRYSESIFKLCNGIELQHIVVIEDLCWQTVNRIFNKQANRLIDKSSSIKPVRRIGIDEIALRKGHKNYVAVIVDLDTATVLDLLEDRSKDFIIRYFNQKGEAFCNQIVLFCSDLWEGYLNAAKEVFPNAMLVTDRFHFFTKLQDCVDVCRRYFRKKYPKDKELINLKWVLLKNEVDLSVEERDLLKKVFAKEEYRLLRETYDSKNGFRDILERHIDQKMANSEIQKWVDGNKLNRFVAHFLEFYERWKEYILNYFRGRYHTSLIEGINNKIKSIKRRAYGFANFQFFRTRVVAAFLHDLH